MARSISLRFFATLALGALIAATGCTSQEEKKGEAVETSKTASTESPLVGPDKIDDACDSREETVVQITPPVASNTSLKSVPAPKIRTLASSNAGVRGESGAGSGVPDGEAGDVVDESESADRPELRILAWNVESDGNDPRVIAEQLQRMNDYHIYALSEAGRYDVTPYADALGNGTDKFFRHFGSNTGRDDRLAFIFDTSRLQLVKTSELFLHGELRMNDWRHRSPLVAHFRDVETGAEFLITVNHLARGNADLRTEQAAALREWASEQRLPVICVGDLNLDYDIASGQGNSAFDEFARGSTWKWVEPEEMIDTNWADFNNDGVDDYPGSMLDFAFVAGRAKSWRPACRIIQRRGDFPDNARTSDHRPVELTVQPR